MSHDEELQLTGEPVRNSMLAFVIGFIGAYMVAVGGNVVATILYMQQGRNRIAAMGV